MIALLVFALVIGTTGMAVGATEPPAQEPANANLVSAAVEEPEAEPVAVVEETPEAAEVEPIPLESAPAGGVFEVNQLVSDDDSTVNRLQVPSLMSLKRVQRIVRPHTQVVQHWRAEPLEAMALSSGERKRPASKDCGLPTLTLNSTTQRRSTASMRQKLPQDTCRF